MHVESVLGHVPKEERCRCREEGGEAKPPQSWIYKLFRS